MRMPRNKHQFESDLIYAFKAGMNAGYGIDHNDKTNEEIEAMRKFAFENKLIALPECSCHLTEAIQIKEAKE